MEKLSQIDSGEALSSAEASKYERYLEPVKREIQSLRSILEAAQAKVHQLFSLIILFAYIIRVFVLE